MTADTYGSLLGLIQQGTGNNNNSWGTTFNTSFAALAERAIAGWNTTTATSGTVDLSTTVPPAGPRLDIDNLQLIFASLVGDLTIQVANISKTWIFWNNTTANGHNVYVKVPGGAGPTTPTGLGGLVQIPTGTAVVVICDGFGNLRRADDDEIGALRISAKAAAGNGELACNGASLLRTAFPNLFAKIGTTWGAVDGTHFTLPNFTDTGRFLRAGGGSGPAVGTYQSNQNKAHTHPGAAFSGTTTVESAGHNHTFSGNTGQMSANAIHSHTVSGGIIGSTGTVFNYTGAGNQGGSPSNIVINSTNTDHLHAFSGTTANASNQHTHDFSGFTGTVPVDAGGTEARPEAAAVLMCIRY